MAKTRVEDLGELLARSYVRPLRLKHLLTGEGEVNAYVPQAGRFLPGRGDTPIASVYRLPPSGRYKDLEETKEELRVLVKSGILDDELDEEMEAKIRKVSGRARPQVFLRRLGNYLASHGGTAAMHHEKLFILLGGTSVKLLSRYKKIGIRAGLFTESGYLKGQRSKRYTLARPDANGEGG
ncbi:MAG: hypothetical protein Q9211_007181 [Gyalolechia sp. 1 TL-2023]